MHWLSKCYSVPRIFVRGKDIGISRFTLEHLLGELDYNYKAE